MSYISSQLDVMRENKKQAVEDMVLGVFFPKCRKKHLLREFLHDNDHDTKYFPSLPKVKEVFQSSTVDTKQAYFISQKKP